jgi:hypothetical protein
MSETRGSKTPVRADQRAVWEPGKLHAMRWTRAALENASLVGWHRFADILQHLQAIPTSAGGVYVVFREATDPPTFLERSPAARWRGDPTEDVAVLAERWIKGVGVVNIGKAKHGQLRKRLRAYHSFGSGKSGRHSGGRYIWQLADAGECLVAWREEPIDIVPRDVEEAMIADFRKEFGKRPFANIVG